MTFPNVVYVTNKNAASALVSAAATAGLDLSGLDPMAQLQSIAANLLIDNPCPSYAATMNGIITGAQGGTGINNGANTLTLGGNVAIVGGSVTVTLSGPTALTFPVSGTILTTDSTIAFASSAGSAATALTAGSATFAATAGTATSATTAGFATSAGTATTATSATTATKLTTGRNINGVLFDGSADITISSIAKLTTARNINGVAFDGSADVTVTAAAGTLTGATLNSTVTGSSLTSGGATFTVTTGFKVGSTQVLGAQQADIANLSTGGLVLLTDVISALGTVQSKINAMLAMFRVHGFMA